MYTFEVEEPFNPQTAMEELTLTTPTLLFSAVSLILLAYTNRFLSYAGNWSARSRRSTCNTLRR